MADKPLTTDDDLHRLPTDQDLSRLQRTTVLYYLHETNPDNGLVRDKTDPNAPVSIAAVGMALATIPVVVERGVLIREFAAKIARKRLRYLLELPAGAGAGRRRLQGLLLPLPRHRNRPPRLGVRAVHHRLGVPVRRRADRRHLLRPRHGRRGRDPPPGRRALPPGRLELGPRRRADADPRLAARRPGSSRTAGRATTRGCCSTCSASARRRTRCRRRAIAAYCATYQWKDDLRPRAALLGPALHPPALAHVDRLSRHPRRLHARRTAATTSRTAGRRPSSSRSTRSATRWSSRATASTAGGSRPATAPAGSSGW